MAGNLKLDSNHDIIIGRGATRVGGIKGTSCTACKCRLLALLGEWKRDTSLGIPWFDAILTKALRDCQILKRPLPISFVELPAFSS